MRHLIILFLLLGRVLHAQNVSIDVRNAPVKTVFDQISEQTNLVFSYASFDDRQKVTLSVSQVPVESVLAQLSPLCKADFKIKGKYVIVKTLAPQEKDFQLSGLILDHETGEPIEEATVYETSKKLLANTDPAGYFEMKVKPGNKALKLHIAKENYLDTSVVITIGKDQELHVLMHQLRQSETTEILLSEPDLSVIPNNETRPAISISLADNIENHEPSKAIWQNILDKNPGFKNIGEELNSAFAISFIPPISTNRLLSGNTKNLVSLNILAGYSAGIEVLEIGGLVNLDKGDVRFVQIAGLSNLVKGQVGGIQVAGIYNSASEGINGLQASGLFNYSGKKTRGIQIGGLGNMSKDNEGVQLAGLINQAGRQSGLQVAGLINASSRTRGMQIAGIFNYADTLQGVQLGLINISKYGKGALPLGLINIVANGYHKLELSYEDTGFGKLAFRTGTRAFHTSFAGGMKWKSDPTLISYGMGLGSSIRLGKKVYLDFEAIANHVQTSSSPFQEGILHAQFFSGFEWQITKWTGLRLGPIFHIAHIRPGFGDESLIPDLVPSVAKLYQSGGNDFYAWLGWKASINLF